MKLVKVEADFGVLYLNKADENMELFGNFTKSLTVRLRPSAIYAESSTQSSNLKFFSFLFYHHTKLSQKGAVDVLKVKIDNFREAKIPLKVFSPKMPFLYDFDENDLVGSMVTIVLGFDVDLENLNSNNLIVKIREKYPKNMILTASTKLKRQPLSNNHFILPENSSRNQIFKLLISQVATEYIYWYNDMNENDTFSIVDFEKNLDFLENIENINFEMVKTTGKSWLGKTQSVKNLDFDMVNFENLEIKNF